MTDYDDHPSLQQFRKLQAEAEIARATKRAMSGDKEWEITPGKVKPLNVEDSGTTPREDRLNEQIIAATDRAAILTSGKEAADAWNQGVSKGRETIAQTKRTN
jgi:hypothetical protein